MKGAATWIIIILLIMQMFIMFASMALCFQFGQYKEKVAQLEDCVFNNKGCYVE